jgi:hypothetical protein
MFIRFFVIFLLFFGLAGFAQEISENQDDKKSPSQGTNQDADKDADSNNQLVPKVNEGQSSSSETDFLNGVEGRVKEVEGGAVLIAPDADSDDDEGLNDNTPSGSTVRLKWAKKYGVWGNYGLGYSTAGFKRASKDIVIGYDKLFFDALEMGLYARMSSLTYVDKVYFENTGYTEKRSYEISSLLLGPHIRYRLLGKLGLVAGGGVSLLQSKLKSVNSDAPLPSSLNVGDTTTFPLDFGYDLGFYYRYKVGQFRVGAEAGYTLNSLKPSNAIGEFYAVVHLEFYGREIVKEETAAPNSVSVMQR